MALTLWILPMTSLLVMTTGRIFLGQNSSHLLKIKSDYSILAKLVLC